MAVLVLSVLAPAGGVLHANAASAKLSRTKLVLTIGQKKLIAVKNLGKGVSVVWKSSKPSVATVSRGTIVARKRGSAKITATLMKNKKKLRTLSCSVRVAEKPVVIASTVVSGEETDYVTALVFRLEGSRSALLTNKVIMMTPGEAWQKLYLVDAQKVWNSKGEEMGWLNGLTVRPYNSNKRNIATAYFARKDYRPFKVTSSSKAVFYFYYDGIKYKTSAGDITNALSPQPCKLTRLTPLSPK